MNVWKKTDIIRMKVNEDKLVFYITFKKECTVIDRPNAIVIDLNENNVTIGVFNQGKITVIRYEHKLGDIVRRYHYKRRYIQMKYGIHRKGTSPNLNPIYRRAMWKLKGSERRRKRDIVYKMCKYIINLAKEHDANVYVGKVNKDSIVYSVKDDELRHRLYQWSVKTIIETLIDKGLESGI